MIFIYFSEVIFPIFPTIWEVQIVIPFIYEYMITIYNAPMKL